MLPANETFDLATKVAANIFRLGNWEIKVGYCPDIILINLASPEFIPNFDIYSDIVYASNGYVVDTVICMGRVLMENRYVPGEEEIMRKVKEVARVLIAR
jgi:5-methylthioadenosine/S-adenosylhomocysteine deaminase